MHQTFSCLMRPLWLAIALGAYVSQAQAQAHVETQGAYTLRVSTVASTQIPEAQARAAGITRAPDKALLNVVVQHRVSAETTRTVEAKVVAQVVSLTGRAQEVAMQANRENDHVSYLGLYTVVPNEVVDISVTATPTDAGKPLTVRFREKMAPAAKSD